MYRGKNDDQVDALGLIGQLLDTIMHGEGLPKSSERPAALPLPTPRTMLSNATRGHMPGLGMRSSGGVLPLLVVLRPRYKVVAERPQGGGGHGDVDSDLLAVKQGQSDEIPIVPLKGAHEQHVFSVAQDDI
jgi:hypothetical protein